MKPAYSNKTTELNLDKSMQSSTIANALLNVQIVSD